MHGARRRSWRFVLVSVGVLSSFLGVMGTTKGPVGYVCFAYRTMSEAGRHEEVKVWIIPAANGGFQVVTRIDQRTGPDEVTIPLFGGPLSWLGLYAYGKSTVDLGWINAVADLGLEPNSTYLTPDGGELGTGGRVQVAGISGIEGTFMRTDPEGVEATVSLVIAEDSTIRSLLPLPLRVEVKYRIPPARAGIAKAPPGGKSELVFFTRDRAVGGEP